MDVIVGVWLVTLSPEQTEMGNVKSLSLTEMDGRTNREKLLSALDIEIGHCMFKSESALSIVA